MVRILPRYLVLRPGMGRGAVAARVGMAVNSGMFRSYMSLVSHGARIDSRIRAEMSLYKKNAKSLYR